jgi:tetratricopeptide (TPR) repeat protein
MNRIVTTAATALIAAAALAQGNRPTPSKEFREAQKEAASLMSQKDYAKAEAAYRKILKDFPNEHGSRKADIQIRVGLSLQCGKEYAKARAEYAKAKDIADALPLQVAKAQLQIGACFRGEQNYAEAIAAWDSMPSGNSDAEGVMSRLVLADIYAAGVESHYLNENDAAIARLDAVVGKYPGLSPRDRGLVLAAKSAVKAKLKDFASAISLLEQAVQLDPAEQYARCMIEVARYSAPGCANMPDKARAALAGVLAAYPTNATIAHVERALTRARAYFRAAEYTASLVPFLRAHAKALQAADGSLIPRMFELIDPTLMSAAEYTALLEHLLLAVKSTKENARFLGVVCSELNKMK